MNNNGNLFKFNFILVLIFVQNNIFAQIKISGKITDKSGNHLPGVNVVLTDESSTVIFSYSLSDEKGNYSLNYKGQIETLRLTVTSFDYEKITKLLSNKSQIINFQLTDQPIELNEVIVKPEAISQRGDTLSYLVSSFSGKEDRVIGDVLKKMPGIEVNQSGSILYNGKEINKFYIENLDLLQGRYGLATKNISAKDVASIQIYENHQPIKAKQNTEISDRAAINIKLKDGSKGTLGFTGQLGAGLSPFIWDNELVALYFAKNYQTITTYKGNNSGNDVAREFTSYYTMSDNEEGQLLSIISPSLPVINQQRYLFNSIHSFSTNNIWVLKKDFNLNANINYHNDNQTKDSYSEYSYFLPGDSILKIKEQSTLGNKKNTINADLRLNINKNKFYINNLFRFNNTWSTIAGETFSSDTINQKLNNNIANFSNSFKFVKTFSSGTTLDIYSYNSFARTPQKLIIHPGLYDSIFNNGFPYRKLEQDATFKSYQSKSSIALIKMPKRLKQMYEAGLDFEDKKIDSKLNIFDFHKKTNGASIHDSLENNIKWRKSQFYISANYGYYWNRFKIDVYLPLEYNLLIVNNYRGSSKNKTTKLSFSPYIQLLYNLNQFWDINAKYYHYSDFGSIRSIFSNYIMQTYRNFNKNEDKIAKYDRDIYSLDFSYKNTKHALFGNINLKYGRYKSNLLFNNTYLGILQLRNSMEIPVISKSYSASGTISNYIYAFRSTISLSGNFHNYKSTGMIQKQLAQYNNINYRFTTKIESQILAWGTMSYILDWNKIKNKTDFNDFPLTPIRSVSNNVTVNLFPTDNMSIRLGYENYYNSAIAEGKNKSFTDLEIKFNIKDIELVCTWSNIFNAKQYITSSYSDTHEHYYAYNIRPSQVLLIARFKL